MPWSPMSCLSGERRTRRWLAARRATWDGAQWADLESETVLVELKAGEQIPKTLRSWWFKLVREARQLDKEPVLILDLPAGGRVAVIDAERLFVRDHADRT